jgi:hypothetical protein
MLLILLPVRHLLWRLWTVFVAALQASWPHVLIFALIDHGLGTLACDDVDYKSKVARQTIDQYARN